MYILYLTQLFKMLNSRTASHYFSFYCNNLIAMPNHARQGSVSIVTFVERLTVHASYLTCIRWH